MKIEPRMRDLASSLKRKYKIRNLHRSAFFQEHPMPNSALLVETRTLIDQKNRFVYSRIPKAANTTVVATLYNRRYNSRFLESGRKEGPLKKGDITLSNMTEDELCEMERDFYLFTFTRNPIARAVSCYYEKIARPSMTRKIVTRRLNVELDCKISFDEFLDFIAEKNNRYIDAHWAPQISFLAFPLARYNLIGSVENLQKDLPAVLAKLGLNNPINTYARHATGALSKIADMSEHQVSMIQEIYKDDFSKFGYATDPSKAALPPSLIRY